MNCKLKSCLAMGALLMCSVVAGACGGLRPDPARGAPRAESKDTNRLTVERIFSGDEFETKTMGSVVELEDGSGFVVAEPAPEGKPGEDLVRYMWKDGKRDVFVAASSLIPEGETEPLDVNGFSLSADQTRVLIFTNTERVWRSHTRGDYWVLHRPAGKLEKLGEDAAPSTMMFAKFSPDAARVAFVRENNLYVEELSTGSVIQLTSDGSKNVINGTFDWAYEEEFGKRDGFYFSPDGSQIAFWQLDSSGVGEFHLMNNIEGNYPTLQTFAYPKVGTANSTYRIGVVDVAGGAVRWMDLPGDPSKTYLPHMSWVPDSSSLLVQQLDRPQQVNRVYLIDGQSGHVREVLTERDDKWVEVRAVRHWLPDRSEFLWLSERDGWRHAYAAALDGGGSRCLTPGNFDVISIAGINSERGVFYYYASPDDPAARYLYEARLDGFGDSVRLSPQEQGGSHRYVVAANGEWALHTHSSKSTPPVTELVALPSHTPVRTMVENRVLQRKLGKIGFLGPEFIEVEIGDGVRLPAYKIRPPDFDPLRQYPVLFYLYGEPAGQVVRNSWGGKRHLWLHMLAHMGYLVIAVDNRGTAAPLGRSWRKSAYGNIGILTAADQAAAAREIGGWDYVDADRMAAFGWSGGGTLSLNLIFQYPELYHTALAVAPVADLRLYNSHYTERYMGPLEENEAAYVNGSPVTHAHRLQGNLLVVHGTGDDNVHYQGTEKLIDELVKHNRRFDMMAYPNRRHGISEGENTTVHLRTLLTECLLEHMPPEGL